MTKQKQNILRFFCFAAVLTLLFVLNGARASAASITRDLDSSFKDIGICQVDSVLNVRSKPSTSGKIVGKIKHNTAAVIKQTVNGENGKWYYIQSGTVKGYAKAGYFETGKKAAAIAKKTGTLYAKVTASSLRIRQKASTGSASFGTVAKGTLMKVLKQNVKGNDGYTFVKVQTKVNGKTVTGYAAQNYVKFCISMKTASDSSSSSSSSSGSTSTNSSQNSSQSTGSAIAASAKSYVGVLPYVWGGTSLKYGADCSGFTQALYRKYGISIPRTSAQQAAGGRSISRSSLRAGDLVCYKNSSGRISHVAIYIGGGKIVHEVNSRKDCKISSMDYTTPAKYVTYLH